MADGMTVLEVLKEARELIEHGWCQGTFALDEYGEDVGSYNENACKFCAWGAIRHVANADNSVGQVRAVEVLAEIIRGGPVNTSGGVVSSWNDEFGRTKEDVLALFDKAIEQETEREANRASMA